MRDLREVLLFLAVIYSHAYIHGLFQVNPGELFNSIKCNSQLKGSTINSQPDRESDQACRNKYDLSGDTFNSFPLEGFLCFSKPHCMLATGSCLSMSEHACGVRLGGIVA